MLALGLCDVRPGQWICDTCAAPGGKSSGLLELLGGSGLVVSNEVIRSRLELLETTLARTGYANYLVSNCEVEQLVDRCFGAFDCVLVDAPCTGQSMLARGKQSLSAFTSRQMEHSAARQQRILRAAAELVKPGGRLVYSTCTFAFVENEAIIDWFLQTHPGWQTQVEDRFAAWAVPDYPGCYRLWPHRDRCAGAFAAALQRPVDGAVGAGAEVGPADEFDLGSAPRRERSSNARRSQHEWSEVNIALADLPWLQPREATSAAEPLRLWRRGDELSYFDAQLPAEWIELSHGGVPIAEWRGGQWQPSYAAGLVCLPAVEPRHRVELSDRQATEYLSGNAVRIDGEASPAAADTPWLVVTWRGRSLGWAKLASGTLKNHLPKLLRKNGLAAPPLDEHRH